MMNASQQSIKEIGKLSKQYSQVGGMKKLSLVLFMLIIVLPAAPAQQKGTDSLAVKEAVSYFVKALDNLDLKAFLNCFTEDATLFAPYMAGMHRANGRKEIANVVKPKFDKARQSLPGPPYLKLSALDLRIQILDENSAIATWETDRKTHIGRRTAVFQKVNGKWLMASYHASNMEIAKSGSN